MTNETTCDLAEKAANRALEMAGINVKDLDLIILATTTADKIFPATATILQTAIGASCPAFDLQSVCAGFIFALTTAEQYIKASAANKVLVVGSETLSRIVNWNDRSTAVLFGDGAGAVVLSGSDNTGILYSKLFSDGNYLSSLQVSNNYINEVGFIEMSGNEVFKIAVNLLSSLAEKTLKETNLNSNKLDWIVPHQANIRIISAVAKRIKTQ